MGLTGRTLHSSCSAKGSKCADTKKYWLQGGPCSQSQCTNVQLFALAVSGFLEGKQCVQQTCFGSDMEGSVLLPAMLCIRVHLDAVQQQRHHACVAPVIQESNQTQGARFFYLTKTQQDEAAWYAAGA